MRITAVIKWAWYDKVAINIIDSIQIHQLVASIWKLLFDHKSREHHSDWQSRIFAIYQLKRVYLINDLSVILVVDSIQIHQLVASIWKLRFDHKRREHHSDWQSRIFAIYQLKRVYLIDDLSVILVVDPNVYVFRWVAIVLNKIVHNPLKDCASQFYDDDWE